jgi:hypothetical protein
MIANGMNGVRFDTSGGMPGSIWYHSFAIIDTNTRRPVVSFGYAESPAVH